MVVDERVLSLVKASPRLATLPSAYARLSVTLDDPNANADKVASVVRTDPALTAWLLKVSNNAAFGNPRHVDTVHQAVVVLGTTRIRHLALAAAVFGVFRGIPSHLIDVRTFWEHSLAVAVGAELIGRWAGHPGTEQLFVSGLLHDIGLLVICANQPAEALRVLHASRADRVVAPVIERRLLGYDHGDVGEQLLNAWGLPAHGEPARFHHVPSLRPAFPTDVVHLANVVATELRLGSTGEPVPYSLDERAWRRIGLRLVDLDQIMTLLQSQISLAVAEYLV